MAKIIPPKITSGYLCDEQPTADSTNLMTSGDIYTAIEDASVETFEFDVNRLLRTNTENQSGLGTEFIMAVTLYNQQRYSATDAYDSEAFEAYGELQEAISAGKKIVFVGDVKYAGAVFGSIRIDSNMQMTNGNESIGGSGLFPFYNPMDTHLYAIKYEFSIYKLAPAGLTPRIITCIISEAFTNEVE